jgi:hypothetical protein
MFPIAYGPAGSAYCGLPSTSLPSCVNSGADPVYLVQLSAHNAPQSLHHLLSSLTHQGLAAQLKPSNTPEGLYPADHSSCQLICFSIVYIILMFIEMRLHGPQSGHLTLALAMLIPFRAASLGLLQ